MENKRAQVKDFLKWLKITKDINTQEVIKKTGQTHNKFYERMRTQKETTLDKFIGVVLDAYPEEAKEYGIEKPQRQIKTEETKIEVPQNIIIKEKLSQMEQKYITLLEERASKDGITREELKEALEEIKTEITESILKEIRSMFKEIKKGS
jgi:uncharacterized protein YqfB (UPF0267 family)